jgi:hypothetical protein
MRTPLAAWLSPMTIDAFVADVLGRAPIARPGTAARWIDRFDRAVLDRILAHPEVDAVAVARGGLVERPIPRTSDATSAMLGDGVGLALRHGERFDPGLAVLGADLAEELPGAIHVQLFVTPARTHGFGWHFDEEDVFIVQTAGIKDYYFRENTVESRAAGAGADFARVRDERSAIATARLAPGDFLYLPARWWHVAACVEESLSISVGAFPDAGRGPRSVRRARRR